MFLIGYLMLRTLTDWRLLAILVERVFGLRRHEHAMCPSYVVAGVAPYAGSPRRVSACFVPSRCEPPPRSLD